MNLWYVCGDRGIDPTGTKGASIHMRAITRALSEGGADVLGFCRRLDGTPPPGMPWIRLGSDPLPSTLQSRFGSPDIVLERYSLDGGVGLELARMSGALYVLEVNAPLVLETKRHRPEAFHSEHEDREALFLESADLVLTVSEPLRRFVAGVRGSESGTRVLRNGADAELAELERVEEEGPPTILFLGHPKPWHGTERLVPLLAYLHERGLPARLVVVGGGPGAESLAGDAAAAGLGESVAITGPASRDQVKFWLARADVSVAPYPADDFFYFCPLKVIESMMAGLPVVTTDVGDLPEIVGDAARIVDAARPEAFFGAVLDVLRDREAARDLGHRARERARRDMTWDAVARRFLSFLEAHAQKGGLP